jgi:hypothetical protein
VFFLGSFQIRDIIKKQFLKPVRCEIQQFPARPVKKDLFSGL